MAIWSNLVFALLGGATFPTQLGISVQLAGSLGRAARAALASIAQRSATGPSRDQVP